MRPYRDSSFFASIVSSSNFIELQAFNEFDQACQTLSFFPLIERAPLRPLNLRGIEVGGEVEMIAIVKDRAERDNRAYRARWAWPNTSRGVQWAFCGLKRYCCSDITMTLLMRSVGFIILERLKPNCLHYQKRTKPNIIRTYVHPPL